MAVIFCTITQKTVRSKMKNAGRSYFNPTLPLPLAQDLTAYMVDSPFNLIPLSVLNETVGALLIGVVFTTL